MSLYNRCEHSVSQKTYRRLQANEKNTRKTFSQKQSYICIYVLSHTERSLSKPRMQHFR